MSRRNVTNDRNTQTEKRTGQTRKSASSAKPARAAASSVYVVEKKKTKEQKKAEERKKQAEERRIEEALTAKYGNIKTARMKKLRVVWWVTLAGAILCTAFAWFARNFMPEWAAFATMALAYVFIIAALVVDLVFIRKERKKAEAGLEAAFAAAGGKKKLYREEERRIRAEMRAEEKEARAKEKAEAKAAEEKAAE
jgi:murein DD-endopeptidase MepM/ murein hydrolase activator NlpD